MKRNKKTVVNQTVTAFLLSMPLTTMAADTMTQADSSVNLDDIKVTGERNAYNPTHSSSNKFTAPLVDTPKTVNVIPQQVIKDTGATTFEQALRTVPGITFGAGEGGNPLGDRPYIRGIDSQNSISVDGMRDIAAGSREMFNVEQIEVVKGADSAFNGRAGAGGSINIVTKKPQNEDFSRLELGAGTDDHYRGTLDINRVLDHGIAVRLNAMGLQEDIPGRDGPYNDRWGIAPSITFGMDSPTQVTLGWYHLDTDDMPDSGVPYYRPGTYPTSGRHHYSPTDGGDRENWYGMLDRDFRKEKTDQLTATVEHAINDNTNLTNTFRVAKSEQYYMFTLPDDSKGNVANGMVWRRGNTRKSEVETVQNHTELSGVVSTGFINHSYSTGIELSRERADVRSTAVQMGDNTCSGGIGAGSDYTCTDLHHPNPHDPWLFDGDYALPEYGTHYETKTVSAYVFDTMELSPQWLVNGGIRFDHYDSTLKSPGNPEASRVDNLWNYQLGLVFKPTEFGSIYANFSTASTPGNSFLGQGSEAGSIDPNGGRNPSPNADDMSPEKTRSYELGTKWNFFDDRLALTAAIFRNEVTNARIVDPATNWVDMAGEKVVDGFELSATGQLTEQWDIFAGYTYMDSEQKDLGLEADGRDKAGTGRAFPNTPRHSYSLWTTYQFTPKFNAGLGLYGQSEVYGGYSWNDDAFISRGTSGYTRYDAMASYRINDTATVQLNIYNLFDKDYYSSTYTTHYAMMGAGRSAVATLKLDF